MHSDNGFTAVVAVGDDAAVVFAAVVVAAVVVLAVAVVVR